MVFVLLVAVGVFLGLCLFVLAPKVLKLGAYVGVALFVVWVLKEAEIVDVWALLGS